MAHETKGASGEQGSSSTSTTSKRDASLPHSTHHHDSKHHDGSSKSSGKRSGSQQHQHHHHHHHEEGRSTQTDSKKSHGEERPRKDSSSKRHKKSHGVKNGNEAVGRSGIDNSEKTQDEDDEDEWEEAAAAAPMSSLLLPTSASTTTNPSFPPVQPATAPVDTYSTFTPGERPSLAGVAKLQDVEMTDGYGEGESAGSFGAVAPKGFDVFGEMGTERKRKEVQVKVDPSQMMGQSSRELNKAHWQGTPTSNAPIPSTTSPQSGSPAPGSSGSGWRMSKLRRTYEVAHEEGKPIEEVALERYGTLEAFNEAKEERRILDERDERRRGGGGGSGNRPSISGRGISGRPETPADSSRRFVFTDSADSSRPPSRGSFRRPGEAPLERASSTTSNPSAPGSRSGTPGPKVFTPPPTRTPVPRVTGMYTAPPSSDKKDPLSGISTKPSSLSQSVLINPDPTTSASSTPILTQTELNKLQAKVLKARLMGNDNADELEKEYEVERIRTLEAGEISRANLPGEHNGTTVTTTDGGRPGKTDSKVAVLPTLDGRGRLYDVGTGTESAEEPHQQSGKRKNKERAFDSHDPKTGEVIRHNADDDSLSLSELVRQERFSAGAQDQKDMDYEMASRIAGDAKFQNDLDYVDENAEKLARKKMKSEVMKKAFAVQDYARTKKALDNCNMCFGDEGEPPRAAVIALGTRAYLGLLENEELVKGHCRIVPIQHHFSSLDADDETWDEIKNFMKTLMQMAAEEDKGVVFFESCINLRQQRHTCIEAMPIPFDLFDEIPVYFREAIDTSEQEWSQHKKRIEFSAARPFRRSLVPNLPYFAVQFDYRGEKGYGHVIEGVDDAPDYDADGEEIRGQHGDKGGGEFPRWFAQEIVGSMLEVEPKKWRNPRRLHFKDSKKRIEEFRKKYDKYDWTKLLRAT